MTDEKKKYLLQGKEIEETSLSSSRFSTLVYVPSPKADIVIKNTWSRFCEMRNLRDQNHRWFGKSSEGTYRTLVKYIDIMEKRWNSDGIPRVNLEDWQASVFKPETRNKVITILSAVAQQRPRMKFKGREKSDYMREVGYDLYNLDYDEKIIIEKKVVTKEVQLQDFYFGSMLTRRMDEQPDCVW